MSVVLLKWKYIVFCHDRGVVDVVAINEFCMKPNVYNFFMIMVSWTYCWNKILFFRHDHGVVNIVENYKNTFFSKTKGSERRRKMNTERNAEWRSNLFFLMVTPRITRSKRSSSSNDVVVSPKHSKLAFSMRR